MRVRRFKPYPSYKDSGVEWLGEIPAHWEVQRLKHLASVQLEQCGKKSIVGEGPVRLCNLRGCLLQRAHNSATDFMGRLPPFDQVRRFPVRAGDLLITKDSESGRISRYRRLSKRTARCALRLSPRT